MSLPIRSKFSSTTCNDVLKTTIPLLTPSQAALRCFVT